MTHLDAIVTIVKREELQRAIAGACDYVLAGSLGTANLPPAGRLAVRLLRKVKSDPKLMAAALKALSK